MSERHQFFNLLDRAPEGVRNLFDEQKLFMSVEALELYLDFASRGEATMARFFATVWSRNDWGFDIRDTHRLDSRYRKVIARWMQAPFWP